MLKESDLIIEQLQSENTVLKYKIEEYARLSMQSDQLSLIRNENEKLRERNRKLRLLTKTLLSSTV
jgi:hypothetical protein